MRRVVMLALLISAVGCNRYTTDVVAASPGGTDSLTSVDHDGLPARLEYEGGSWQVVIGSLNLLPNGFFVLAESDTIWNGHAFVRNDWTDGGTWTADGSMLILADTTDSENDPYGASTSTYLGTITPRAVLLTIPTNDGSDAHVYRYEQ
jgi:hypothetical protein